jgi:hypothetical protein
MASGPMHASIERLRQVAAERRQHYQEKARTAGTPGRREDATRNANYYTRVLAGLTAAARASEHQP